MAQGTAQRIFAGEGRYTLSPGVEIDHLLYSAKELLQGLLEETFCPVGQCSVVTDNSEMWRENMPSEKADEFFDRESPLYFRAPPFFIGKGYAIVI